MKVLCLRPGKKLEFYKKVKYMFIAVPPYFLALVDMLLPFPAIPQVI